MRKYSRFVAVILVVLLVGGCVKVTAAKEIDVKEVKEEEVAEWNRDFAVSVSLEERAIVLSESPGGEVLKEIPTETEIAKVFLVMTDEETGFLLYCSTPACGQMIKVFYVTKDRWKTYSERDISYKIDGYPNALSVLPGEQIYIGTQMRSNGYLFASADGGENWEPVVVDEGAYFRDGYAPVYDESSGKAYVFMEYDGTYYLYRSEYADGEGLSPWERSWEKAGVFSLDEYAMADEYFIRDGELFILDSYGKWHQLSGQY